MPFASVNGAVAHFADEGPREPIAFVFINSLGADFRIWDELVRPMAATNRVLRYDKRGHGLSELPPGSAGMEDYASDLAALIDRCEIRIAFIVGLSIGGVIAQQLYRQRPDLVAALTLCDTAAKIGTEDSWRDRIATVRAGGVEPIAEQVLQRWFSAEYRATRREELAGWRAMLTRTPVAGYVAACEALRGADLRPFCADIKVPTLCLVGDEDGSTPVALVREFAQSIPGARFEIVRGAGHLPNLEQPETVRALIEAHARAASL